jgi:hypothetical protein
MDVRPGRHGPSSQRLFGDGALAALTARYPWQDGPLGPLAEWPQSLRSVVGLVLEAPLAMIVLWGPDLIQIYNDAYAVICGPRHPTALGQPTRLCWPEVWAFNEPIYDAVRRGETRSFTRQLLAIARHGDLEDAWFDLTYSPVRDEAGAVAGVMVTVVEVTAQVLTERRLDTHVARQRKLFDQAPGFICILAGPDHVYEFVNRAYERIVLRTDLIGRTIRDALPDISGQGFYELLDTVYATGQRFNAEHVPITFQVEPGQPPEVRYVDFVYEPVLDEDGQVTGIFTLGYDVTEAHLAKLALHQAQEIQRADAEFLRGVMTSSNDCIKVLDLDANIVFMNEGGLAIMEIEDFDAIRGCPWPEFWHGEGHVAAQVAIETAIQGRAARFDGMAKTMAGKDRWWDVQVTPIRGPSGDPVQLLCVSRDISGLREAELSVRLLNADLETQVAARIEELRGVEAHLQQAQKMEAVGQLTGGIAHDFNNMLTGVIGGLDVVQRRMALGQYDDLGRFIDLARQSGERAADLTHRLLAFSRRQSLVARSLEVNALVQGMEEMLRRTLGENIRLVLAVADDAWAIVSDPGQVENALLNLCINARDAMPDGGELRIETANMSIDADDDHPDLSPGDYVRISVTDQGMGMPPETVVRAFEPFFTTKPIGQGTGLGLSMIYGFAKQSRGHAEIFSDAGRGTTVSLWLPRSIIGAVAPPEPLVTMVESAPAGVTVLIVEDEPSVRFLIREVLSDMGLTVLEAADSQGALAVLASAQSLDLLVTDVGLPGMNGRSLADAARRLRPELKVLFVTGYAEQAADRDAFLDEGMAIVAKPFTIEDLANQIRCMLADVEA